jgi:hypothetical protein
VNAAVRAALREPLTRSVSQLIVQRRAAPPQLAFSRRNSSAKAARRSLTRPA